MRSKLLLVLICGWFSVVAQAATVIVPAGRQVLILKSNTDYVGAGVGKTFILSTSTAANSHCIDISGLTNVTFTGITFGGDGTPNAGGGIKGDNTHGLIEFKDCSVENCKRSSGDHQGVNMSGSEVVRFTRVTFKNNTYDVILNNLHKDFLYDHCVFDTSRGPVSKGMVSNGTVIKYDWCLFVGGLNGYYGIEIQPSNKANSNLIKITISNSAYVLPQGGGGRDSGAFSIPEEFGWVGFYNNYINGDMKDGTKGGPGGGYRGPSMTLEIGANGGEASGNWIEDCGDALAANLVCQNLSIHDNRVVNCDEPMNMQGDGKLNYAQKGTNKFFNNTATTPLPEHGGWELVGLTTIGTATVPPKTILTAPAENSSVIPGQTLTVSGTGLNLRWEIDRVGDGLPELKMGTGNSITFRIPADATAAQTIRIRLIGDGGTVDRNLTITVPVPPNTEVDQLKAQIVELKGQVEELKAQAVKYLQRFEVIKGALP